VRNEPRRRKARSIIDVTSTALGKAEMTSRGKEGAVWHVDPLLGNDRERSSYTTAVAK
jgi:hypothetical protein